MAEESWTPLKLLDWTGDYFRRNGVDEPRLDAELLLAEALGIERINLYTRFDRVLTSDELDRYRSSVKERAAGRPARYITGKTEFYSLPLKVDERVLIPRPETELLVERALELAGAGSEEPLVVELGTGSGAVAVALAANCPGASVVATDSSREALDLARENAAANGAAERVEFVAGDLFEPLYTMALEGRADLIVSNPPYVSEGEWEELPREIREHEPRAALVAGPQGTEVQRRILEEAFVFLCEGGRLLLEIDPGQCEELDDFARSLEGWSDIQFRRDFSGRRRVLEAGRAP